MFIYMICCALFGVSVVLVPVLAEDDSVGCLGDFLLVVFLPIICFFVFPLIYLLVLFLFALFTYLIMMPLPEDIGLWAILVFLIALSMSVLIISLITRLISLMINRIWHNRNPRRWWLISFDGEDKLEIWWFFLVWFIISSIILYIFRNVRLYDEIPIFK